MNNPPDFGSTPRFSSLNRSRTFDRSNLIGQEPVREKDHIDDDIFSGIGGIRERGCNCNSKSMPDPELIERLIDSALDRIIPKIEQRIRRQIRAEQRQ